MDTPVSLGDDPASRSRWLASAFLGTALGLAGIVASQVLPFLALGHLEGSDYALVGLLQICLVPLGIWIGLRPTGRSFRQLGVRGPYLGRDAAIGLAVAVGFAVVQFGLLIPLTGGAARDDVVMNVSQLGGSLEGLAAFIVLALTGGFAEELLFRGHLLTALRNGLGRGRAALVGAGAVVVVLFALLHGYQGWAGVIDTGLYGGVILTVLFINTEGRLTACFVAHAGWNIIASIVLYGWFGNT